MAKANDPDAKRVVVEYDDGSTRELKKGAQMGLFGDLGGASDDEES